MKEKNKASLVLRDRKSYSPGNHAFVSHQRASRRRTASLDHSSFMFSSRTMLTYRISLQTPGWRMLGPLWLMLKLNGRQLLPLGVFLCICTSTRETLEP